MGVIRRRDAGTDIKELPDPAFRAVDVDDH
jgi:hypothetical protein